LAQWFESTYKGELHYDHHRGRWYHWDGKQGRWALNETRLAFHFAREVCRSLNGEEKKEFARASTYGEVERICQCSPDFAVTSGHWDRDIWLLGVPGGTIDLRTGEQREARASDYITRQTAVAPNSDAESPVFDKFLGEITRNDKDLERYLQRMAGSALTGSTQEQKVFFIFGPGKNGKSVFISILVDIAGDYARTAAMESFIEHRYERHSTDIAMLAGARLVTASETQKGRRWNEALIGRLTGGDLITARFMRQNNFTFAAQFTLIIVGNHAPELGSVNEANRRRFSVIPFNFSREKADEKLAEKLREERPARLRERVTGMSTAWARLQR
jgi:putative DNA primase/helicase